MQGRRRWYSAELLERAVRQVAESRAHHDSDDLVQLIILKPAPPLSGITGTVPYVTKRTDRLLQDIEGGAPDSRVPIGDLLHKAISPGGGLVPLSSETGLPGS